MPFYAVLTLNLRRNSAPANECGIFGTPVYRRRQQLNSRTTRYDLRLEPALSKTI